jgi:hypothetical protein
MGMHGESFRNVLLRRICNSFNFKSQSYMVARPPVNGRSEVSILPYSRVSRIFLLPVDSSFSSSIRTLTFWNNSTWISRDPRVTKE